MVNVEGGTTPVPVAGGRGRVTPIDRTADLLPWRRAPELTRCRLYWMPVSGFPLPGAQRGWVLEFLKRVIAAVRSSYKLRPEQFLQLKTAQQDLMEPLLNNMMELLPIMGLGRKPGTPLPPFPSQSEIQRATKSVLDSLERDDAMPLPDTRKHAPDYAYWFLDNADAHQRELFFGHGGLTIAFFKPDKEPPPLPISQAQRAKMPMLKELDLDKMWATAHALNNPFRGKSKELFGAGLENEPQAKGLPFILPLLDSADFFGQPEQTIKNCFELFDIYVRESPADNGILLAAKMDLDELLIGLLRDMRAQNMMYPES
jgi:hypothetical protein